MFRLRTRRPSHVHGAPVGVLERRGHALPPAGLVMAALYPLSGYLADRTSMRAFVMVGLVLTAWSCWLMREADAFTPVLNLVIWFAIGRVGLAFVFPSLNAALVNALPLELIPRGAGMISFVRQLGGALGVNLLSFALIERTALHQNRVMETQTSGNSGMGELLRLVQEQFSYLGFAGYQGVEVSFGYVLAVVSAQGACSATGTPSCSWPSCCCCPWCRAG